MHSSKETDELKNQKTEQKMFYLSPLPRERSYNVFLSVVIIYFVTCESSWEENCIGSGNLSTLPLVPWFLDAAGERMNWDLYSSTVR